MELWNKACALVDHTMDITRGKKFQQQRKSLADKLDGCAIGIAYDLWLANHKDIRPNADPREAADRRRLQKEALALCENMYFLVELAGKTAHRPDEKTELWVGKAADVENLARKWMESDAKRLHSRG